MPQNVAWCVGQNLCPTEPGMKEGESSLNSNITNSSLLTRFSRFPE